jgi:hypothetical protein
MFIDESSWKGFVKTYIPPLTADRGDPHSDGRSEEEARGGKPPRMPGSLR